jgi:ethanolamine utilization protein EutQ (cupin superfamily)
VVEAIVKNERAHTIEEIGDTVHDEISIDREEEEVVHAAVQAKRREEQARWAGEEVPYVKAVNDAAVLAD